ncbi:hypothetical protein H0H92_012582 [Tricholoma furcatifolium]|nr:hypothetical protein H0H92_012582 [Tricholoma furcatifolium]
MASSADEPGPFEPTTSSERYTLQRTLQIPSHVSCLAFGHAGHLFAGSDDGSLRVYDLSSFRVLKAVRGIGAEVSSLVCVKRPASELRDVWIASGTRILKFKMDSTKMIQGAEDAIAVLDVSSSDTDSKSKGEDVLNEIALNANKTHVAFSLDSGAVGVVDLATNAVSRMKAKHDSVCGSVKFIPDRPRELVSGGYDTALLHFDFYEGKVLSSRKIPPAPSGEGGLGLGLSPPFITSLAISPTGIIAAGTADGRLLVGCGGYKAPKGKGGSGSSGGGGGGKGKRSRKWEGLNAEEETTTIAKIAEGPIVALAFGDSGSVLTTSTLMGVLVRYEVAFDEVEPGRGRGRGRVSVDKVWQLETQSVKKVNALAVDEKRVVVGGLTADGKGVVEIWKKEIEAVVLEDVATIQS